MLLYSSTRNPKETASPAEAVLRGIAPDGGLYMIDPARLSLDWREVCALDFYGMAEKILGVLLPEFSEDAMHRMVEAAYRGRFAAPDVTPLTPAGDAYLLELFHGPTSAFKDVALSILPRFITEARVLKGETRETLILTATSGDTGKAALEGFRDVPGTHIIVFYPSDGVSAIQRQQMVTQEGDNVAVAAVQGNFDDAQTGVKEIFVKCEEEHLLEGKNVVLSSANSINIGRLAPQLVYYFKAYADLMKEKKIAPGDPVHFVVPTGNFGDILAGYLARCLGLPVGRLVCASNKNDVLTEFLTTGRYDRRREFFKTESPSMDILISSNLERLLYLASGCDSRLVAEKMQELKENGWYEVPAPLLAKIQEVFLAGSCDDEATRATIKSVWERHHRLLDPHTAVAWNVYEQTKEALSGAPTVVLSTASPYKFAPAVLSSLEHPTPREEFACMEVLSAVSGIPVPPNLAKLRDLTPRHLDCIHKEEMADYVKGKAGSLDWNR